MTRKCKLEYLLITTIIISFGYKTSMPAIYGFFTIHDGLPNRTKSLIDRIELILFFVFENLEPEPIVMSCSLTSNSNLHN